MTPIRRAAVGEQESWWQSLSPGATIHHHVGRGAFVRGRVERGRHGMNVMRCVALVGEWPAYDLPHLINGEVVYPYYCKLVLRPDYDINFRPNSHSVWECPEFNRDIKHASDPTQLEVIELDEYGISSEQGELALLLQLRALLVKRLDEPLEAGEHLVTTEGVLAAMRVVRSMLNTPGLLED